MKAYKATYNQKCLGKKYEVGETYLMKEGIVLCLRGFHCCKKADDVFKYYQYTNHFVLFEVEVLGRVIEGQDKIVTDKFKVLRIIPPSEYNKTFKRAKFYKNGTKKYVVNYYELFRWCLDKYDEAGNLIYRVFAHGAWFRYTHSNNNRIVDRKGTYGKLRRLVNSIKIKIGFIT